ncbi:alkene reductase [Pseudochelatococcus contaminans]|uniref:N-ethylmaleimide reductase n=1 Tax=Pseudochelatococcus contaminans TaxID=1538103 RepID=A0A7W5Z3X6_9HYPH|nr:alkene reductase [Pseudochelatococcus contaminans]MBB3809146.1 N-ethylmaleimide reductase [Pseudochelatococcus contaminans]
MTNLFDPVTVGDLTLPNRIALAPLTRNRSPGAVPTELTALYYTQRAEAGLLITEATAITHQGQGYSDVPGLYSPEQLAGWRKVTDSVHAAGGHIYVQLWHVGRISHNSLQPEGKAPVAPSAIAAKAKTYLADADGKGGFVDTSTPRALEASELPGIIEDFRKAVSGAVDTAGFDGVEVHSANGYLLDQFLRSGSNHRTDEYGGSIENRLRFPLAVTRAIVETIGGNRTGIRISPVTPANDASDPDPQPLFEAYVRELAKLDLAYVHVIEGATGGDRDYRQGSEPFDYAALKAAYRDAGGKGAWILNNGYTLELAQAAVEEGRADLVAFGKPFIANPDLVRRFREGAPLNEIIPDTLYGGGEHGYTDYPTLG